MDIEVLKSYLVSLGFSVDQPQMRKFEGALTKAGLQVGSFTRAGIGNVLEWQAKLTGAFVAVGAAVIGMADHVAMSDQKYRLMGLRMFMTTEAARKLSVGMDALGASMEEIAWDPELRSHFLQLSQDQDEWSKQLGENFESNMRGIRDLRFEFSRLNVAFQYGAMEVVSKIFERLGFTVGTVQDKLEAFIAWLKTNMPGIASNIADRLVPILEDAWKIAVELGQAFAQLGVLFTNVVGLFSGDRSIEGTEFSFNKLADAVGHVVHWISTMILTLTHAEQMLVHFADAAVLALSGKFADAKREAMAGLKELGPSTGAIAGAAIGTLIAPGIGTAYGMGIGAALGGAKQLASPSSPDVIQLPGGSPRTSTSDAAIEARQLAIRAGAQLGVDPRLIFEQWAHETNNFSSSVMARDNNMAGIRVNGGAYQRFNSLSDFADRYVEVLKAKRYQQQGIGQAHTEEDFAAALKRGGYFEDSYDNYLAGMKRFQRAGAFDAVGARDNGGQQVSIGEINVHVTHPGASDDDVRAAVTAGVADHFARQQKQTQRSLAQLGFTG